MSMSVLHIQNDNNFLLNSEKFNYKLHEDFRKDYILSIILSRDKESK